MQEYRWLSRFLERRGLKGPDGRHLYAYRTSSAEFRELQGIVRAAARRRDFPQDRGTPADRAGAADPKAVEAGLRGLLSR